MNVLSVSATTTPSIIYDVIFVDASSGDVTIHLPISYKNKSFIIKKTDITTNNVFIDTTTSDTIEFTPFYTINTFLSAIKTVYNGIQWFNV